MNRRLMLGFFAAISACLVTGCGTISARGNSVKAGVKPYPYPGVVQDAKWLVEYPKWMAGAIRDQSRNVFFWPYAPLLPCGEALPLVDLPLSAMVDTVILPADIDQWIRHSSTNAPTGNGPS